MLTREKREFFPAPNKSPELSELEDQLIMLEACIKLSENEDRAVSVKFCMTGGKEIEYWIENNSNLRPFLLQEIEDTKKLISEEALKNASR